MVGIVTYGVYVPLWRLDLSEVQAGRKGERAIANFDEDSLTMGVAAGMNCLGDIDRSTIDGLYFSSTTSPYREKPVSVIAATALDLRTNIRTADFANSLRVGTTALEAAVDTVKAGSANRIMVIAADVRIPAPGSDLEVLLGDGAVAFIVGRDSDVTVEIQGSYTVCDEILDVWRSDLDTYVRSWEARFALDEGYFRVLPAAVSGLLVNTGLSAKDFDKAVLYGPDPRRHRQMAKQLGFDADRLQDGMFGSLGDTGAAFALMMLAAALDSASEGDRLLLASYGNGADAFVLKVVRRAGVAKGIESYISSKRLQRDYKAYLRWRGLLDMVTGRRRPPTPVPSASSLWRERDQVLRLHGVRCTQCGTVQYPPQRVCTCCHAKDQFQSYRFSDKKAAVFTYGIDYMTPNPDPPRVFSVVDFDGGGRMWLDMTDKDENELEISMPVEVTLRKLFTLEGIHNYYWKSMPARF